MNNVINQVNFSIKQQLLDFSHKKQLFINCERQV